MCYMPSSRSGSGDPDRTLALLWRAPGERPSTRGPRRALSVDEVVDAATALADEAGLDDLTMRRVAERLGISPMSIYTYVPGKEELLDLMLDRAYLRMARTPLAGGWRAKVRAVAADNRTLFEHHPWITFVSTARPPLGPGLMAKYEHELAAFDGLGLTDVQMDDALSFVLTFVQAAARAAVEETMARRDSAMNDAQWWEANAPLLAKALDPQTYPLGSRVGSAAGEAHGSAYNAEHVMEFGLDRVIDGLVPLIERRQQ